LKLAWEVSELTTEVPDTRIIEDVCTSLFCVLEEGFVLAVVENIAATVELGAKLLWTVADCDGGRDDGLLDLELPMMLLESVAKLREDKDVLAVVRMVAVLLWTTGTENVDGKRIDVEPGRFWLICESPVPENCCDVPTTAEEEACVLLFLIPEIDEVDGGRTEVGLSWI
jgi:hypothetical protein